MDSSSSKTKDKSSKNVMWTPSMDAILIRILVEQASLGHKGDNGWKPCAYRAVISAIRSELDKQIGTVHIRSRLKTWRKEYTSVRELLETSGFGWNDVTKMVEAPDSVWNDAINLQRNKIASKYRGVSVPNFNDWAIIIGNDYATGVDARTPLEVDMDLGGHDEDPTMDLGLDENNEDMKNQTQSVQSTQTQSIGKRKRTHRLDNGSIEVLDKISEGIMGMNETLKEVMKGKKVDVPSIMTELRKIEGFDRSKIISATKFISSDPTLVGIFFGLTHDDRIK